MNFELFKNPPNESRPMPFWFINNRIEKDEIRRQVQSFHEHGIGGVYYHARFGLETEYLSEAWMDGLRAAAEMCSEYDMELWIYDENLFPSGIGNLKVSRDTRFRPKFYVCHTIVTEGTKQVKWTIPKSARVVFVGLLADGKAPVALPYTTEGRDVVIINTKCADVVYLLTIETVEHPNDMIFGVDYLHPDMFPAYLASTHELYERSVGQYFGNTIKGFFTDEPTLLPWHHNIAWYIQRNDGLVAPTTNGLAHEVSVESGLALDDASLAAALFFDTPDSAYVRPAYYRVVEKKYTRNFFTAYADWCEARGLELTGHVLFEEGIYLSHIFQGGTLRCLRPLHMPGCDQLYRVSEAPSIAYMVGTSPNMPRIRTNATGPKHVSSIAHLAGRRRVLSESYGCGGFGIDYSHQKRIFDWGVVLGVNRLCPHAFFYSIEGFRKYDAPTCHFHSPLYALYKDFADYVGRLSWAMSQGEPIADTAVLYPSDAFESVYAFGRQRSADRFISDCYEATVLALLGHAQDFEIVYDDDIENMTVSSGRLCKKATDLKVGDRVNAKTDSLRFERVFVFGRIGLPENVQTVLDAFEANGGKVYDVLSFAPPSPQETEVIENIDSYCLPVLESAQIKEPCRPPCFAALDKWIASLPSSSPIRASGRLYAMRRRLPEGDIAFLVNQDETDVTVSLDATHIARLDCATGDCVEISNSVTLAPDSSILLLMTDTAIGVPAAGRQPAVLSLPVEDWSFSAPEGNMLFLHDWQMTFNPSSRGVTYHYNTTVTSDAPFEHVDLLLDDIAYRSSLMGEMDITVICNGREAKNVGWRFDPGIRVFSLGALPDGETTIELVIRHNTWCGQPLILTQPPILTGRFAVRNKRLVPPPKTVSLINWREQGYQRFAGSFEISRRVALPDGPIRLTFESPCAAEWFVDGAPVGRTLWNPHSVEIGDGHPAEVEVLLRLYTGLSY